jgi:hypothetical protein
MAGERLGSGRPRGIWGRLSIYRRRKGAVSGFGEAVLDRALADETFVAAQLESLRTTGPMRAKDWAIAAIAWLGPEVRWAVSEDKGSALALETQVEEALGAFGLWSRVSMKRSPLR